MSTRLSSAFITMAELYQEFADQIRIKKVKKETIKSGSYSNEGLEETEDFIPNNFTLVQCDTFEGLSPRAIKLVINIISSLKENNALWEFDHRQNQSDKKAITELRNKSILIKTETPSIHIVNPIYVRRGTPAGVAFKTRELLSTVRRVNKDHIISLRSRANKSYIIPTELIEANRSN